MLRLEGLVPRGTATTFRLTASLARPKSADVICSWSYHGVSQWWVHRNFSNWPIADIVDFCIRTDAYTTCVVSLSSERSKGSSCLFTWTGSGTLCPRRQRIDVWLQLMIIMDKSFGLACMTDIIIRTLQLEGNQLSCTGILCRNRSVD